MAALRWQMVWQMTWLCLELPGHGFPISVNFVSLLSGAPPASRLELEGGEKSCSKAPASLRDAAL